MKKLIKIAALVLVMLASLAAFTACSVDEIYISEDNMPRLIFIEGQDIDLSGGLLTVVKGDSVEEVALASKDVKISGYDKNKVSKQEITIEYKKKTTTITIEVVSRVAFQNVTKAYFVGDSLDYKGQLYITPDNGKGFAVPLTAEGVTLTGFDSSAVGTSTVTAKYVDENTGKTYTGTLNVNIYALDGEPEFKAPGYQYLQYQSHETALKLTGSYIKLSGNGGALTRNINLTANMVKGFDLSLATVAHRTTPLKQQLTVTYGERTYNFTIEIFYSDITYIRNAASQLKNLSWTGNAAPDITEEQGEVAVEAARLYTALTDADKKLITEDEWFTVLRPAVVYGEKAWNRELNIYSNTISSSNAKLYLVANEYERTKADYQLLLREDNEFVKITKLLNELKSKYAEGVLYGETKIANYLSGVIAADAIDTVLPVIEHLIVFYEKLSGVPIIWNANGLTAYQKNISEAVLHIGSKYNTYEYRAYYSVIKNWRADFFDILYTYYYTTAPATDTIAMLQEVQLPGDLETVYTLLLNAISSIGSIGNTSADTIDLVLDYNEAIELYADIEENGSAFHKELLANLKFSNILTSNGQPISVSLQTLIQYVRQYGYNKYLNTTFGSASLENMWKVYTNLFTADLSEDAYQEAAKAVLKTFLALSPAEQNAFIRTENVIYYSEQYGMELDFVEDKTLTTFEYFIGSFFHFGDDAVDEVFKNLMLAAEYYSLRYTVNDAITKFKECMEIVIERKGDMASSAEEFFMECTGNALEKYLDLYEMVKANDNASIDLGDWADTFALLDNTINVIIETYNNINTKQEYVKLLAYFEYAEEINDNIVKNAPASVLDAYYYCDYSNALSAGYKVSLEYAFVQCRARFGSLQSGLTVDKDGYIISVDLWTLYKDSGLGAFFATAVPVIGFTDDVSAESVTAVMNAFRNLNLQDRSILLSLDINTDLYYKGLKAFVSKYVTNEKAKTAANKLLDVEKAFVKYAVDTEGSNGAGVSNYNALKTAYEAFEEAYAELLNDDNDLLAFNTYFADMYSYYKTECDKVIE